MMWGANEDTFIIKNIDEFVKVLPKYFKTKNYSSFVRQLNIYDFHKVKNPDGHAEFQHPKFRKDNFSDLTNIKRKSNEIAEVLESFKGDQKNMLDEYSKLKANYQDIEESLAVVASQNRRLVETNKELVCKLYFFKKEYENRIKKILFCFYVNNNYHNGIIAEQVQKALEESGMLTSHEKIDQSNCLIICDEMKSIVKNLTKRLIFTPDKDVQVLDKLVEIYIQHINDNIVYEKTTINWRTILDDMFRENPMDSMVSIPNPATFTCNVQKIKRNTDNSLYAPYKMETDLSFLNKDSSSESVSLKKSENDSINEEDLLGEITRKLGNVKQSVHDSFIASDAQSLNLFSPMSEKSNALKF